MRWLCYPVRAIGVSRALATREEERRLPIYIDASEFEPSSRPAPVWSCGPVRVEGDDLVLDRESATTYQVADKPEIRQAYLGL